MYTVSEKKALKRLGIPDFRHMTSEKIVEFVNMTPHMNPEVVKAAIEQFPEFKDMSIEMTNALKDMVNKAFDANKESQQYFYESCNGMLETLRAQLEDEDIDANERSQIRDNMMQIISWMAKKDSENKEFIEHVAAYTAKAIVGIAGLAVVALGAAFKVPIQNLLKSSNDDEDEEDE